MARRVIYVVLCFVLLLTSNFLAASSQEEPTFVIVLLDETSAKTSPFGTRTPVEVRSWAVQLLEALADRARKTQSDFRIRIMKFSFDDENMIKRYPTLSLSPDNRVLLKQYIYDNCFGRTHIRTTKRERLRATLCKVLNDFEVNAEGKNRLFLISDTRNGPRIHDTWLDSLREWLLGWLGCRFWRFSTVLERYREFGSEIHALFVPIRGLGAAWLAGIVRQTRGRFIEEEQCIPRSVWTVEEILKNVASRLSVDVSLNPDNVLIMEGQRMITLKSWLNYDDQKLGIREGITWEECEKIDIDTLKATVFLDDKEFGRLEWNQKKGIFVPTYESSFQPELTALFEYDRNEKVLVFSLGLACDRPHTVQITIDGKIARWIHQELPFSLPSIVVPIVPNVDVAWSKGTDAYLLELSYGRACGETSDKRGTVKIEYKHDHFDLIDEKGNPISGDEISFDDTRRTLYLKVKPNLELGPHEGTVTILPNLDCANLKVDNACKFEQSYELTVLKFDREKFTFPNLCFPPDQSYGDSFTAVLGPIRLDGIPEDWDWDLLKTRIDPSGFRQFPEGIPCPEITNIQGDLFNLKLTIASCSALRDFKEAINSDPVDGYLEFVYEDPSKYRLRVFKVSPMPVGLTYREKWIRIIDVKDFTEGILHGGDKAFIVSLEYSPDLAEEEKCVEVVFDAQDLELFDEEGTLNESSIVYGERFTLRVHRDIAPGHKTEELWMNPPASGIYLYCSAKASHLTEDCRYPQDTNKEYEFDVPFIITIQNEKFICPNIRISKKDREHACNLELQLGPGTDAPNWGKLIPQVAELDGELRTLGITISTQVNPAEILPPFADSKNLQLVFNVDVPEPLSLTDWEKLPDKIEGVVRFEFSDGDRGIVELSKRSVPFEALIPRPPLINVQVKDCSREPCPDQDFKSGILHKGEKAFLVTVEYVGSWREEEKQLNVLDYAQDLELYDENGNRNMSGTIEGEEFTLRVRSDISPGTKSGTWRLAVPDCDTVYFSSGVEGPLTHGFERSYEFEVPYNVEILNENLICNIHSTSAGQTPSCDVSLNLGQGRDAPSSGRLRIQITINGLSGEAYLDPPFAGNKQFSVNLSGEIRSPVPHVTVHPHRDGRKLPADREITVKLTQRPASYEDVKLFELHSDSVFTSAEGGEATDTLGGNATVTYHPEESADGPTVELNGSTDEQVTIPIEAIIHRPETPCRVETTCTSNTLAEDTLRFVSSQEREKEIRCGEPITVLSGEDVVSVYAKADTSRGVHDLVLNLNGVNCDLSGDTDIKLRLCVRHPIIAGVEYQSRWLALVFFALPMLALLIAWILYLNSGYDSFREYVDELRWRWGKWIYIVPPISVGLAFLASVAWLLAAACVIV